MLPELITRIKNLQEKLPQNPLGLKNKIIAKYKAKVLSELLTVFQPDSVHGILLPWQGGLELFFTTNWRLINSTLLSYTTQCQDDITTFLLDLSMYLADELNTHIPKEQKSRNPITLLMPTVATESLNPEICPDLEPKWNEEFQRWQNPDVHRVMNTHILGREGKYLIPLGMLTKIDLNNDKLYNYYCDYSAVDSRGENLAYLNADEKERLQNHSSTTKNIFHAIECYKEHAHDGTSLLAYLKRLIRHMRINSVEEKGTENNAGEDFYMNITHFFHMYDGLSEEQRSKIPPNITKKIHKLRKYTGDKNTLSSQESCLATQREKLEHEIEGNEVILSNIVLEGDKKGELIEKALENIHAAIADLNKQLNSTTPIKGSDNLYVNQTLAQNLGIEYTCSSFEELHSIPPEEMLQVAGVHSPLWAQLSNPEDLMPFLLDSPHELGQFFLKYIFSTRYSSIDPDLFLNVLMILRGEQRSLFVEKALPLCKYMDNTPWFTSRFVNVFCEICSCSITMTNDKITLYHQLKEILTPQLKALQDVIKISNALATVDKHNPLLLIEDFFHLIKDKLSALLSRNSSYMYRIHEDAVCDYLHEEFHREITEFIRGNNSPLTLFQISSENKQLELYDQHKEWMESWLNSGEKVSQFLSSYKTTLREIFFPWIAERKALIFRDINDTIAFLKGYNPTSPHEDNFFQQCYAHTISSGNTLIKVLSELKSIERQKCFLLEVEPSFSVFFRDFEEVYIFTKALSENGLLNIIPNAIKESLLLIFINRIKIVNRTDFFKTVLAHHFFNPFTFLSGAQKAHLLCELKDCGFHFIHSAKILVKFTFWFDAESQRDLITESLSHDTLSRLIKSPADVSDFTVDKKHRQYYSNKPNITSYCSVLLMGNKIKTVEWIKTEAFSILKMLSEEEKGEILAIIQENGYDFIHSGDELFNFLSWFKDINHVAIILDDNDERLTQLIKNHERVCRCCEGSRGEYFIAHPRLKSIFASILMRDIAKTAERIAKGYYHILSVFTIHEQYQVLNEIIKQGFSFIDSMDDLSAFLSWIKDEVYKCIILRENRVRFILSPVDIAKISRDTLHKSMQHMDLFLHCQKILMANIPQTIDLIKQNNYHLLLVLPEQQKFQIFTHMQQDDFHFQDWSDKLSDFLENVNDDETRHSIINIIAHKLPELIKTPRDVNNICFVGCNTRDFWENHPSLQKICHAVLMENPQETLSAIQKNCWALLDILSEKEKQTIISELQKSGFDFISSMKLFTSFFSWFFDKQQQTQILEAFEPNFLKLIDIHEDIIDLSHQAIIWQFCLKNATIKQRCANILMQNKSETQMQLKLGHVHVLSFLSPQQKEELTPQGITNSTQTLSGVALKCITHLPSVGDNTPPDDTHGRPSAYNVYRQLNLKRKADSPIDGAQAPTAKKRNGDRHPSKKRKERTDDFPSFFAEPPQKRQKMTAPQEEDQEVEVSDDRLLERENSTEIEFTLLDECTSFSDITNACTPNPEGLLAIIAKHRR